MSAEMPIFPLRILSDVAQCACGHIEDINGLTDAEMRYQRGLRHRFPCMMCQATEMIRQNALFDPSGGER